MIVIVGPTASGKTDLAVALARAAGGEVISADSRQIYRGLEGGTGAPALDENGRCEGVPCHLVGFQDPAEPFDAGRFAQLARPLADEIRARGKVPIVAGGTGLYLRALLEGLSELPPRDEALRRRLLDEALRLGRPALHARLEAVDPAAAAGIPSNNIQRLVRALEVHELTGRPISSFWGRAPGGAESPTVLRIDWPAPALRARIEARTRTLWPRIQAEARALSRRFSGAEPGFQSLGYREAFACLRGELPEAAGFERLLRATLSYAKRQRTWFRHQVSAAPIAGAATSAMLEQTLALLPQSLCRR